MRAADGIDSRLRQAEVLDLPRLDEFLHSPRHILNGHVRIDPVLVKQVDAVSPETLQRPLYHVADTVRPAVQHARLLLAVLVAESKLGGDNLERRQGLRQPTPRW